VIEKLFLTRIPSAVMVFPVALTIGQTSIFSLEVIFWIGCHEYMTYLRLNLLCRFFWIYFYSMAISLLEVAFSMLLGMSFLFSWLLNIFTIKRLADFSQFCHLHEFVWIYPHRIFLEILPSHLPLFFIWSQIVSCLISWSIWATVGFEKIEGLNVV
jgi:hypothetical protein